MLQLTFFWIYSFEKRPVDGQSISNELSHIRRVCGPGVLINFAARLQQLEEFRCNCKIMQKSQTAGRLLADKRELE